MHPNKVNRLNNHSQIENKEEDDDFGFEKEVKKTDYI